MFLQRTYSSLKVKNVRVEKCVKTTSYNVLVSVREAGKNMKSIVIGKYIHFFFYVINYIHMGITYNIILILAIGYYDPNILTGPLNVVVVNGLYYTFIIFRAGVAQQ